MAKLRNILIFSTIFWKLFYKMNKIGPKEKFDPKKCIPQSRRIPSSDHHFYRFGFSQYRNGCTHRSKLYHPLLVFILPLLYTLRCLYSALIPPKTNEFHLIIGNSKKRINNNFLTLYFEKWFRTFKTVQNGLDSEIFGWLPVPKRCRTVFVWLLG